MDGGHRNAVLVTLLFIAALILTIPSPAFASGPPLITNTTFSAVTPTSATLEASLNPNGAKVNPYRFEYVDQATFQASGFAHAERTPDQILATASQPVPLSAVIEGLTPQTPYHFRLYAKNANGELTGPEATLYTISSPPAFAPCENDPFRSGAYTPPGHPSAALPDCRAYERASPADKNGGDVVGTAKYLIAADTGAAITFASTFGFPGGTGAQSQPLYQATRAPGEAGWGTTGLLPPETTGQKARYLLGYLPDLSASYAEAIRLGEPRLNTLLELHQDGSPPTTIAPYSPTGYGFAGVSADAGTVLFEASDPISQTEGGPLIPGSAPKGQNVYAWDRTTGQLRLASTLNTPTATEAALAKGAYAGPYDWANRRLDRGGGGGELYLTDTHVVSKAGDLFFTSASSGALYERFNPTQEQSPIDGQGNCTDAAKACTIEISTSQRSEPDPAGPAPAAFLDASTDGRTAYFTSSQKLTDDANTGPEVSRAQIGRALPEAPDPSSTLEPSFLPAHALGLATDPSGEYIYWADPLRGTIGRANLKAPDPKATVEPEFIVPGEVDFDYENTEPQIPLIEHVQGPSHPKYVAAAPCAGGGECVYWTGSGPLADHGGGELPVDGHGTIGRAELDGSGQLIPASVDPEWITGASGPQGIAVNESNVYWANKESAVSTIGRATIEGGEVDQEFKFFNSSAAYGLALSPTELYVALNDFTETSGSSINTIPLAGGPVTSLFLGPPGVRGVTLGGGFFYWASQGNSTVGRIPLADFTGNFNCSTTPSCEAEFLHPGGTPLGLAADAEHLYFSVNGESPPNPGNDLYRYSTGSNPPLTDLTADSADPNGAEVQGLAGASEDGSYLYFVANAVLAANTVENGAGPETAQPGDCHGQTLGTTKGQCNLYLYHAGQTSFIARLAAEGSIESASDVLDWTPTPHLVSLVQMARTARASADGQTLLFRSRRKLTAYDSHGIAELYRFRLGAPRLTCVSCPPSAAAAGSPPTLGTAEFPGGGLGPATDLTEERQPHFLSTDGNRAFFQSTEALLPADTNGQGGCPKAACLDLYEWEAPGEGSCAQGGPAYSPLNEGCLYLISTGTSPYASIFADASADGKDVYFLTRQSLVGGDQDQLYDVYDARVEGGLAAQNPLPAPPPCEAEGCKPRLTEAPAGAGPQTPSFHGSPNPEPKRPRCKKHCHKPQHTHKHHRHRRRIAR